MSGNNLRDIAELYANLIMHNELDTPEESRCRNLLGMGHIQSSPERPEYSGEDDSHVGIWKFNASDKSFIIDDSLSFEFSYYNQTNRIPPKGNKKRVVLLGESVARGMLYDPVITPATMLEKTLNLTCESEPIEVIDLARTGIRIEKLEKLCKQSLLLMPDMVVIFAGNNFKQIERYFSKEDIEKFVSIHVRKKMVKEIKVFTEQKIEESVRHLFITIDETFLQRGIPIVYVLPETNLRGWKQNYADKIHRFDDTGEYDRIRCQVEDKRKRREYDEYLRFFCEQLLTLDDINPYAHEILGEYYLLLGNSTDATDHYRRARDSSMYLIAGKTVPLCHSFTADCIRKNASRLNIRLIDLPNEFSHYCEGSVVGPELFLDYCHLTLKGLKFVTKSIAQALLKEWNITSNFDVDMNHIIVDDSIQGNALFQAAMVNANNGQPFENMKYYCEEALLIYPQIKKQMLTYAMLTNSKIPWCLSKYYAELLALVIHSSNFNFVEYEHCRTMDIYLIDAILSTIGEQQAHIDIWNARVKEHGLTYGKCVNLLETYYSQFQHYDDRYIPYHSHNINREVTNFYSIFQQDEDHCQHYQSDNIISRPSIHQKTIYYSAIARISSFVLVADCQKDVFITICLRIPHRNKEANAPVVLKFNETDYFIEAGDAWRTACLRIDSSNIYYDRINYITVTWPNESIENAEREYEIPYHGIDLLMRKYTPVYGEIATFNACITSQIDS